MSQAFVRESEEQWLHEVSPTLPALLHYLSKENNGIKVYEVKSYIDPNDFRLVHFMSNGLSYSKDEQNKWYVRY